MADDLTASTPVAAAPVAASAPAPAAATHSLQVTTGELTMVKEALVGKVRHHASLAVNANVIQAERDRHVTLKTAYSALLEKVVAASQS